MSQTGIPPIPSHTVILAVGSHRSCNVAVGFRACFVSRMSEESALHCNFPIRTADKNVDWHLAV